MARARAKAPTRTKPARRGSRARGRGTYLSGEDKAALVNRLNRCAGQVQALSRMVEDGSCADDVLIQIAAAKSALMQVAARILERHLTDCATTCMVGDPDEITKRVTKAVTTILKHA